MAGENRKPVVIESPFKGETKAQESLHRAYLEACLRDSILKHGEAPIASQREIGIHVGLELAKVCERSVFYIDLGMSSGMERYGLPGAHAAEREIVYRRLGGMWSALAYLKLIDKTDNYNNWLNGGYDGGGWRHRMSDETKKTPPPKWTKRDDLAEVDPEILCMDGFDDCIAGWLQRFGMEPIALYDREKVLNKIMKDGGTYEQALEFYEFNQLGGWVGERTPGFLVKV